MFFTRAALVLATVQCGSHAAGVYTSEERLGQTLQETQIVGGYEVQLYANLETKTWTLFVVDGDLSCIVEKGNGWRGMKINNDFFRTASMALKPAVAV